MLVVEDETYVAAFLSELLDSFGHTVIGPVASGEKAVEQAGESLPDLVLMDILLEGDLDGVAAAEEIQRRFDIPVVYVTGYADENTLQRARLTNPFGFVIKPFEEKQLMVAIDIALHKHSVETRYRKRTFEHSVALKSIDDAVLLTDEKGLLTFLNPAGEALTGWRLKDASGLLWTEIFNIVKEDQVVLTDSSSVVTGLHDHAILVARDGTRIPIDYSAALLRNEETNRTTGFAFIFRDVNERRQMEEALVDSRRKYKELLNSIDGVVWEADPRTHQFFFVSKHARKILGFPADRWLSEANFWHDRLHPEDRQWALTFFSKVTTSQRAYEVEYRLLAADGRTVWVRDVFNAVPNPEKQIVKLRGVLMDITERKQMEHALREVHADLEKRVRERTAELSLAVSSLKEQIAERKKVEEALAADIETRKKAEEALRKSEERYAIAALGANDGLWDWDLKSNEFYFSTRWKSMLGWEETEIGGSPDEWFQRVHPEDLEKVKAAITAHLSGVSPHFESEHRMIHKDGTYRWMLTRAVALRDEWGAYRMAGSQSDITARKIAVDQLLHDAFHDALTNLANRALFMDRLKGVSARAASRIRRGGQYLFAVLFLDLDRFKIVNDSLGHHFGDQLLIEIARRLQTCLRPGDTIARLGGDEFAILIEDIDDINDAIMIAERVQTELRVPFSFNGHEVFTTASIGIALSFTGSGDADDLLRDADTAMYRAKALGKARYQIFDISMHGKAVALLQLETDMRRAIERQEFVIHYQPIVALASGLMTGFEALVRWQHPDRGLLGPEELIPVAEETGLILPIGRWVLWQACRQMKTWQQDMGVGEDFTVSVNLSAKQFSQLDLNDQVARALSESGLDPQNLKLEITESVIMESGEFASSMLLQLRDLNVRLQIDDFGTGYSSLSYLHRFPIHTLKIDRSFVSRIGVDSESWEIVRTIVTLANNLGMDVVAEGVETSEQKEQLLALGCQYGQGFFYSKPVDAEAARNLILNREQFA